MSKKTPQPVDAYLCRCARCGYTGWSSPADYYGVGQRPYGRPCLSTRGAYPSFPEVFLCTACREVTHCSRP